MPVAVPCWHGSQGVGFARCVCRRARCVLSCGVGSGTVPGAWWLTRCSAGWGAARENAARGHVPGTRRQNLIGRASAAGVGYGARAHPQPLPAEGADDVRADPLWRVGRCPGDCLALHGSGQAARSRRDPPASAQAPTTVVRAPCPD
eukprot:6824994-Prymnesium_polylepis.1